MYLRAFPRERRPECHHDTGPQEKNDVLMPIMYSGWNGLRGVLYTVAVCQVCTPLVGTCSVLCIYLFTRAACIFCIIVAYCDPVLSLHFFSVAVVFMHNYMYGLSTWRRASSPPKVLGQQKLPQNAHPKDLS